MKFYAENFKRLRKSAGMTQRDIAKALKITFGNVGSWEHERSKPGIRLIPKMAELLKCNISDICEIDEAELHADDHLKYDYDYDSLIYAVLQEELKHLDIDGKRRLLRTIVVYTTDNIKFRKERAAAE